MVSREERWEERRRRNGRCREVNKGEALERKRINGETMRKKEEKERRREDERKCR